jgi:hypothetical protein
MVALLYKGARPPCEVNEGRIPQPEGPKMNSIIYIIGLVVVVLFILGFLGLA